MSFEPQQMQPSDTATRVLVLMYHRVGESVNAWEQRYCVEPSRFAAHMRALHKRGYRPVRDDDFFDWLAGRASLPAQSFLLTFDDAFEGVFEHARPVLLKLGWTATVFAVSGRMGGDDAWDLQNNPAGRRHRLMTEAQVRTLAQEGFSIQSHSRLHRDLTAIPHAELRDELAGSRAELQALIGQPVRYLAYPFGQFNAEVQAAAVAAGYCGAFSTKPGFNYRDADPLAALRLDVAGTDSAGALVRKMRFGTNDGSYATTARYLAGRIAVRARLRPRRPPKLPH